jgi:hypothetical protein
MNYPYLKRANRKKGYGRRVGRSRRKPTAKERYLRARRRAREHERRATRLSRKLREVEAILRHVARGRCAHGTPTCRQTGRKQPCIVCRARIALG